MNAFLSRVAKPVPLAAAAFLLVCSGTAFAAEGAQPHDFLYPVKIQINEPLHALLLRDAQSKTAWEAVIADRRLHEALALREAGTLDAKTNNTLAHAFAAAKQQTETGISALQSAGDTQSAEKVSKMLAATMQTYVEAAKQSEDIHLTDGNTTSTPQVTQESGQNNNQETATGTSTETNTVETTTIKPRFLEEDDASRTFVPGTQINVERGESETENEGE